jgi:hypothetical protein
MEDSVSDDSKPEPWAQVIEDILDDPQLKDNQRVTILEQALDMVREEKRKNDEAGGFRMILASDAMGEWQKSPACRFYGRIKKIKARTIYRLTRQITNNSSPRDAATLLFNEHRHVAGSGCLGDYIDDLPRSQRRH